MLEIAYIQTAIFTIGLIAIIIAGVQDKKTRLAPAMYLPPTLIGFGINPFLGLIGLIGTILLIFFYKTEWNEKLGLADILLFFTLLITLCNPFTRIFTILITLAFIADLLTLQKTITGTPLIWIFSKWLIIISALVLIITLIL